MPDATQPVIAVGQFLDQVPGQLTFTKSHLFYEHKNEKKLVGRRTLNGLYESCMDPCMIEKITGQSARVHLSIRAQVTREQIHRLHRSLGHISKHRMKKVLEANNFTHLRVQDLELLQACDACHTGKIKRSARTKSSTRRATTFGHTIRSDSTSRQPIESKSSKRYANIIFRRSKQSLWRHALL